MNRARAVVSLTGLSLAAGCSNPLFSRPEDFAHTAPAQRLRAIERADFSSHRKPAGAPAEDPAAAARRRFEALETYEVSLEQARASALANNLDLRVALVNPTIAAQQVREEEARFESAFTLRSRYTDLNQPTASELISAQSQQLFIEPGVRIPLRTGGSASVTLPMNRSENNNRFSTLNPAYSSDLQFSISQPLLRNAGRRTATAPLRIAGYNAQSAEAQTKLEVIRQLAAVDRAYWRLYATRQALEVTQQQYELAAEQRGRAERRVNAGQSAEVELIRAEAGVAQRLEAIIQAENAVLTQQRELKRIINLPGLTIDSGTMVVAQTPPDPVEYEFDRNELMSQALSNRMELLDLELRLAADAATIAFNKNQALPLLTVDYVYRVNGLGASTQDAFSQLQGNRFEDWELGLNAEVPIGNEAARSRVREAILRRLQRLSTRDARRLAIQQEVLQAVDQIDAAWQRILAARQSVVLNTRLLAAEQRQFDVGNRTSTDVLNAASALADAQLQEIRALADYQVSQIDLAFATGTLLGAARVEFEPAAEPDHRQPAPPEALGVGPGPRPDPDPAPAQAPTPGPDRFSEPP
jgi:outer membrane protein TolC